MNNQSGIDSTSQKKLLHFLKHYFPTLALFFMVLELLALNGMVKNCMERLKQRFILTQKAFATLNKAIIDLSTSSSTDPYFMALRDSLIQRFKYSIDTLWKLLKIYIEQKYGVEVIASPKAIFKACLDLKIIDNAEYSICIKMIDDRNMSSHAYLEDLAQEISMAIPQYYPLLQTILNRIKI